MFSRKKKGSKASGGSNNNNDVEGQQTAAAQTTPPPTAAEQQGGATPYHTPYQTPPRTTGGGQDQGAIVDDDTVLASGNPTKATTTSAATTSKKNKKKQPKTLEEQVDSLKREIAEEKAGKKKLFHSLVKLAKELRQTRNEAKPVLEKQENAEKPWYEGGLWRAPQTLPGIGGMDNAPHSADKNKPKRVFREAISLSDMFFNLVVVTAFTRVGVSISQQGHMDWKHLLYFAIFWDVWYKEVGYATRFDTTDVSAQMETLLTCFAVLFASLSVSAPMNSADGTRIMLMAALVAILHCLLHLRVAYTTYKSTPHVDVVNPLAHSVIQYALFNVGMTILEGAVWLVGIFAFPVDWNHRWIFFALGVLLGLRVPRAFLNNDFHAACSQRGVLFILLLGFLLQSIVVVASEFFEYQTPNIEHYAFLGSACLMLFCIKLMYVDDADTMAEDHALLVNRWAAFFFSVGQFCLLLSTTVMGSGLNLLTHDYMAASAALPGPAKTLVCGGFSAVLLSTFFIKSMHLKRVPTDGRARALFVGAYVIQAVVLLAIVGITAAMCFSFTSGGVLQYLMQTDIQLLFFLSGAALFVVLMSWLDEGVELTLYESMADSREYRVSPFGLWWCLKPQVITEEDFNEMDENDRNVTETSRLSALSPLLGSSMADLKNLRTTSDYQAIPMSEAETPNVGRLV